MTKTLEIPEVQDAIRILSRYNLGAVRVHMHDDAGAIVPLKDGLVQLENELKVSFVPEDSGELADAEPVAWAWKNGNIKTVAYCGRCP